MFRPKIFLCLCLFLLAFLAGCSSAQTKSQTIARPNPMLASLPFTGGMGGDDKPTGDLSA